MNINKDLFVGFWLGVAVISLINILLIVVNHNQLAYDLYISVVSIIVLVVSSMMRARSKRHG
jgi:formate-dependent nitrite reductase membrane component NrfD